MNLTTTTSAKLFAPRSPKPAPECVCKQEHHLAQTCGLLRDAKLVGERCDGVGVDGSVEVHADLEEDSEKDGPLLTYREGEAETVIAVSIVEHDLVVGTGWRCDGLF